MNFGKTRALLLPAVLVLALGSCADDRRKDGPILDPAATGSGGRISTAGFLKTSHADLSEWLDQRFEVDYKHMTPQLIFDQVPLNQIYYETRNLPSGSPAFNFSSQDISRRELLKRISQHWGLNMTVVTDQTGTPTAIRVEG